jgi:hypothetical protein
VPSVRRALSAFSALLLCLIAVRAHAQEHPAAASPAPARTATAPAAATPAKEKAEQKPVAAATRKAPKTASGESLEALVERVRRRIAEQQTRPARTAARSAASNGTEPSRVKLEWRPGVVWPTELLEPPAQAVAPEGRVNVNWETEN